MEGAGDDRGKGGEGGGDGDAAATRATLVEVDRFTATHDVKRLHASLPGVLDTPTAHTLFNLLEDSDEAVRFVLARAAALVHGTMIGVLTSYDTAFRHCHVTCSLDHIEPRRTVVAAIHGKPPVPRPHRAPAVVDPAARRCCWHRSEGRARRGREL